jgi:hypothetical protein
MAILKAIGLWLLKTFLGGLFQGAANREAETARAERDRARIAAGTADEAKSVEREIMEEQIRLEKTFKERQLPEDDLFGIKAFNRGE